MKTPSRPHPLDYLFVCRPVLLMPVWTVYLLGASPAAPMPDPPPLGDLVLGWLLLSSLFASVYLLNQVHDVESDRQNRKLHFLPLGLVSVRQARAGYVVLNVVAGLLAWRLSHVHLMLAAAIGLLGWLYSAPSARIKNRPYAALAANAVAHGSLVYLCGFGLHDPVSLPAVIASSPYFFAVGAVYLLTAIPDIAGDAAVGKVTLPVLLGPRRAARWAQGWYWAGVLMGLYTLDVLFLLAALPASWWFIRARDGSPGRAGSAVRNSVLCLSLAACFHQPWYLLILATGFLFTRMYYRWRFDLRYP